MAKDLMDLLQQSPAIASDPGVDSAYPERLLVLVIGNRDRVINTIHELHQRGFAPIHTWSPLLPGPSPLYSHFSLCGPFSRRRNRR